MAETSETTCDAPTPPTYLLRMDGDKPVYGCRCVVCGRCGHHTGNSNQGHLWAYCKVTGTRRDFHFCCPDNCELEAGADAAVRS